MQLKQSTLFAYALIVSATTFLGQVRAADPAKDAKPPAAPEMKLPPGWTEADMQACMAAGVPGKMHEYLLKGVGVWQGKNTMWGYPGADPIKFETTATVTSILSGHYTKCETTGDMAGMGPFNGLGLYGFDNASGKFVATWMDNFETAIMPGTGELSPDGKTLTWNFTYISPIDKKPAIMREIETNTGPDSKTLEMFSTDPKTGKEFKMMTVEYTRKP